MVRKVYLVGIGMGDPGTLTEAARAAIAESGLLVGAPRMLEPYGSRDCLKAPLVKAGDIAALLRESDEDTASVLFSGDVGFYSGAKALAAALAEQFGAAIEVEAVPGISSLVYFCARLLVPWQDAHLVSAHGRACDVAAEVRSHAKTFFLTGGARKAGDVCAELVQAGLGDVRVRVGERLSYADEKITSGAACKLAGIEFDSLAVMLVENDRAPKREPGRLESANAADDSPTPVGTRLSASAAPASTDALVGVASGASVTEVRPARRAPRADILVDVPANNRNLHHAPRLLVAAPASGTGKTTFSCGLMQALVNRRLRVQACKCGPDYIDPMFHREVIGASSRNLDMFFMGADQVRGLVAEGARDADVTVVEGAMGYYDGIAMSSDASAWDVARATETPAVLVVDARGRARSVAAEVAGFARFRDPSAVAGVVLNRCSAALYPRLKDVVERECGVRAFGYIPVLDDCGLESRHLGLVTAAEVDDLRGKLARIAAVLEETVDISGLLELAGTAPPIAAQVPDVPEPCAEAPVIAVARDDAFCFYYDDALSLLERLGARLAPFSPLADESLPEGACGLYLGGGYPELHARQLSANAPLLAQVRAAIEGGMPTIAECGGFMYLHEALEDDGGARWPMVGAVPGVSFKTEKLGRFGYIDITAKQDNLLCKAGASLPAHEFHYWDSENPGVDFHAQKPQSARNWDCVHASDTLYAGYPHLCLHAVPESAARFVAACARYGAQRYGAARGGAADGAAASGGAERAGGCREGAQGGAPSGVPAGTGQPGAPGEGRPAS